MLKLRLRGKAGSGLCDVFLVRGGDLLVVRASTEPGMVERTSPKLDTTPQVRILPYQPICLSTIPSTGSFTVWVDVWDHRSVINPSFCSSRQAIHFSYDSQIKTINTYSRKYVLS